MTDDTLGLQASPRADGAVQSSGKKVVDVNIAESAMALGRAERFERQTAMAGDSPAKIFRIALVGKGFRTQIAGTRAAGIEIGARD